MAKIVIIREVRTANSLYFMLKETGTGTTKRWDPPKKLAKDQYDEVLEYIATQFLQEVDALAHVSENFFCFKGTDFHEILMIFRGALKEPIREECLEQDIEVRWFSGEELEQIDIRPQYTKAVIYNPERITQWIVNDERK